VRVNLLGMTAVGRGICYNIISVLSYRCVLNFIVRLDTTRATKTRRSVEVTG